MSWVKGEDGKNKYWIPDVLPEPTSEWNQGQREKRYFDPNSRTVKVHPKWYFDNCALVSDEYLNLNDGWLLVVDNYPEVGATQIAKTNPQEDWIFDKNTATVTYSIYTYIYPDPPQIQYNQKYESNSETKWIVDEGLKTITQTFTVTDLTEDELLEKDEETWLDVRYERNKRLSDTDHIIIVATEKNLTISDLISPTTLFSFDIIFLL